jgi:hypothetical protein
MPRLRFSLVFDPVTKGRVFGFFRGGSFFECNEHTSVLAYDA